jgi:hypothetical protein
MLHAGYSCCDDHFESLARSEVLCNFPDSIVTLFFVGSFNHAYLSGMFASTLVMFGSYPLFRAEQVKTELEREALNRFDAERKQKIYEQFKENVPRPYISTDEDD